MMRRVVVILAVVAAMVFAAPARAAELPRDLPISFGGPFSLVDHNGEARTDRDFRGGFLLVYFGYTYCPDICPTGLQAIAETLDVLGPDAARITPVFVSVDPGRDTPAVLKDYVANFHPRMVGLTGSQAQIRAAARAYRVHRAKVGDQGRPGLSGDPFLDHPSDRAGRIVEYPVPSRRQRRVHGVGAPALPGLNPF